MLFGVCEKLMPQEIHMGSRPTHPLHAWRSDRSAGEVNCRKEIVLKTARRGPVMALEKMNEQ